MIKKSLLILSLSLMLPFANATIMANVDHADLELGQSLTLSITLPNSGDTPDLAPLKANFNIYGTSSSSQISIINGQRSSQATFDITLMPKNAGKQFIPALKVGNDTTAQIAINVSKNSTSNQANALAKNNLLAELIPTKTSSYVGVPIVLRLKIYVGVTVNNLSMDNFNLANAKIQPQGKALQYQDMHNGRNYQVVEQKYLLTPNSVGTLSVPALQIRGEIPRNANRGNGFFAMLDQQPFVLTTKPVDLTIKPIPNAMNPSNWLPASQLKLSEDWQPKATTIRVGEALTRNITLETDGVPASSLPELQFSNPKGINAYPEKSNSSDTVANNKLHASKTFKIVYVATQAGKVEFPATNVKWWDIDNNKLQQVTLPATNFEVLPEHGNANNSISPTPSSAPQKNSSTPNETAPTSKWFYISMAIAAAWIITMAGIYLLWRSRSKPKTSKQKFATDQLTTLEPRTEKECFKALLNACQQQNLSTTNQYLIRWAAFHWQTKVYSVADIKDLQANPNLNQLLDQFTQALYRGEEFNQFQALADELTHFTKQKAQKTTKTILEDFYPH